MELRSTGDIRFLEAMEALLDLNVKMAISGQCNDTHRTDAPWFHARACTVPTGVLNSYRRFVPPSTQKKRRHPTSSKERDLYIIKVIDNISVVAFSCEH